MSSTFEVQRICEYCGKQFTAKTSVTRFCGKTCTSRSYKKRIRDNKIGRAVQQTNTQKLLSLSELNIEAVKQKDFLSIKEAYSLLGISERTFYRLMKQGKIKTAKLGSRTIIRRTEIDKLFEL